MATINREDTTDAPTSEGTQITLAVETDVLPMFEEYFAKNFGVTKRFEICDCQQWGEVAWLTIRCKENLTDDKAETLRSHLAGVICGIKFIVRAE